MTEMDLWATCSAMIVEIDCEMVRSCGIHDAVFSSPTEAIGVITEEYYEVVEAFRKSKDKYPEGNVRLRIELVQLAAMCKKAYLSNEMWQKQDWDDLVSAHIENISKATTMEALGEVTVSYQFLLNLFCVEEQSSVVMFNKMKTNLLTLYMVCLKALMSCCVYSRTEPLSADLN